MVDVYQNCLSRSGLSLQAHQVIGVSSILSWHDSNHGGIIADDMGLGKTCQSIAALCVLETKFGKRRNLIISPLSVIDHWEIELLRFGLGKMHFIRYTGDAVARSKLRKQIIETDWNILLTTYQYVIRDAEYFINRWKFSTLILDEAHRLKSMASVLHQVVREIKAGWILLLTGTPIQNSLQELYSLLTLVDKRRFLLGKVEDFMEKYKNMDSEQVAGDLRTLLSAYLLRRTKEEVSIEIPVSTEVYLYHGMSDIQRTLYRAILCKNYQFFERIGERSGERVSGNKTSLLNVLMQLRKCVLHPYLFEGVEPEPFEEGEHLIQASGKFALLDRLLKFLKVSGHRVLLFSQMTRVLDVVQDFLTYRDLSYERLDGSVRAEERYAALRSFQEAGSKTFCFLLSTRAGGVGLNLTGADTVVFLDSDFNPQNDLQAAARCHRIGQKKPVKVIRLIARNTIEEVIQYRANRKLRMTRRVLGCKELERESMTAAEISTMILFGLGKLNEKGYESEVHEQQNVYQEMERLIGRTKDGEWVVEDEENLSPKGPVTELSQDDAVTDLNDVENKMENMYLFEGHDYKKDREVLHEIVTEGQMASLQSGRVSTRVDQLVMAKRTRRSLTKEQIEERARKRAESLKKKKEEDMEARQRREREREEKRKNLWEKNNYTSCNLPLPAHESEEDSGIVLDSEPNDQYGPFFVVGDVTKPVVEPGDESKKAVIAHVVDDSGRFGRGGVFDALRAKSSEVEKVYELAGKMDDLRVGYALLVDGIDNLSLASSKETLSDIDSLLRFDDVSSEGGSCPSKTGPMFKTTRKGEASVVLLVAQQYRHRDQISQEALAESFSRLAEYAEKAGEVSVHLPRIGYGMRNVQWYIIERLIRKHLTSKHIPTYVYYFKRRAGKEAGGRPQKRRRVSASSRGVSKNLDTSKSQKRSTSSEYFSTEQEKEKSEVEESEEENMSDKEGSSDEDLVFEDSSSGESMSKRKLPAKRSRRDPESLFENVTFSLELLNATDRSRYRDIILSQEGLVIDGSNDFTDVRYVLVDPCLSQDKVLELRGTLPDSCRIVKKGWIDECFDVGGLTDPRNFLL